MADHKKIRVSIGFDSAPPLAVRVTEEDLAGLRGALSGSGWYELDVEDGTVTLKVEQIVFLRVEKDESKVGFGLG